ncbi:MAG: nodulation protein NfeD [Rhodospirillales bacterium]|nr:MAG: nodulation protein NfeD [Rhodospirillales bacterium]
MLRTWRLFSLAVAILAIGLLAIGNGRSQDEAHAVRLVVKGPIGPAVADYIRRGLKKADERGAVVVILQMDTPGGLDTSMREIIQDILASPVPVIGYVGPSGARAASAGTYMLYATHLAVMAPATNLGAATPVQMGDPGAPKDEPANSDDDSKSDRKKRGNQDADAEDGDSAEDAAAERDAADEDEEAAEDAPRRGKPGMDEKMMQDAVAYIRSLAQKRGRNAEWAEKAVTEAASLSAEDALDEGVIDFIAETPEEILEKADGRTVDVAGVERTLKTRGLAVVNLAPDWRTEFLEVITNPTVAYLLLFTIGLPALMIEFYTGTLVAGVIGAICIVLGLYGLHVLPISYAGAGLILLGFALIIGEVFMPSFGALGIGGVVAFVIGSVMLIETDVPGFGVSPWAIGGVAAAAGAMMLLILTLLLKSRKSPVVSGRESMIGSTGTVVEWSGDSGRVRFQGEIWQARSADGAFAEGARVVVGEIEGLTLVVGPEGVAETES